MTNLTDRYVATVLGGVPGAQRADLEPEVRALVADAIEAQTPGDWLSITSLITVIVVVIIVGWDAIDGFLKARRAEGRLPR